VKTVIKDVLKLRAFRIALIVLAAYFILTEDGFFCLIAVASLCKYNYNQRQKSNYISSVKKRTFRWNVVHAYLWTKLLLLFVGGESVKFMLLHLAAIAIGTYFGYRLIKRRWNRNDVETVAAGWTQGNSIPAGAPALPTSVPTPTPQAPASTGNGGTSSITKV
jgi:hypothetical protein